MVKPEQCSVAEEKQPALIKPAFLMQNTMDPINNKLCFKCYQTIV